jgi:hypothetical protein
MYIEEDLENMLQQYPINVAKLNEARRIIKDCEDLKKIHNKRFTTDDSEEIEAQQLSSTLGNVNVSGKTNKISDTVPKVAMNYRSKRRGTIKIDLLRNNSKLEKYKKIEQEISSEVEKIDNLLNCLNNFEHFITIQLYMNCNKNWTYVQEVFKMNFREKSIKQLKRYQKSAMEKMLAVLNI